MSFDLQPIFPLFLSDDQEGPEEVLQDLRAEGSSEPVQGFQGYFFFF